MKGKRVIELEEGQELDETTYDDLYTHARNSGIWYANNMTKTTHEFRKKLLEKGYPKEGVLVRRHNGELEEVDIISEVIDSLVESLWMDDERYAERYAERKRDARYGRNRVSRELQAKGIPSELIEAALETAYAEEPEEAEEKLRSYLASEFSKEAPRAPDQWKLRRKLLQRAVGRGWSMDDIMPVLDELMEDFSTP